MTGAILAGGQSRRMGFNKAFIKVDGTTIIERAIGVFRKEFDQVYIVANDIQLYESLDVRVYADLIKGAGSIGGIYTALFHSPTDFVFVAACDMPFLDAASIKKITEAAKGDSDAVVPFIGGRFHPLHAAYSRKCMKPMERMIRDGKLRINDLLEGIRVRALSEKDFKGLPIEKSVENVNTKEDLTRIGGNG